MTLRLTALVAENYTDGSGIMVYEWAKNKHEREKG